LKNSSYRLAFAAPSPTTRPLKRAHWDVKRAFDIIVSALLLTLGAPLLAAIALLVRARLGAR
jgi:lipopolysaccharide/colanic/teichoic acid biosynthesis glycosyltransferase